MYDQNRRCLSSVTIGCWGKYNQKSYSDVQIVEIDTEENSPSDLVSLLLDKYGDSDYYLMCDSNCIISRSFVDEGLEKLESNRHIDFIYSDGTVQGQVLYLPSYRPFLTQTNQMRINVPVLMRPLKIEIDNRFRSLFLYSLINYLFCNYIGWHIPKQNFRITNAAYSQEELDLLCQKQ